MGRQRIRKWLLIVLGVIAVGLGAIGVFIPLLPTTPFLLLAAACFMRSSDRLYTWLVHLSWLGSYIRNYREHHAMELRAKVVALTLLWGMIGYSAVMATESWWLRILLGAVAVGVTIHLLCLKTLHRHADNGRGALLAKPQTNLSENAGSPARPNEQATAVNGREGDTNETRRKEGCL